MKAIRGFCVAFFAVLIFFAGCNQVDFVAPTGSTINMTAQPTGVDYGGASHLQVIGTRTGGAPLPDDTTVYFTVADNLGTVDPNPSYTKNGIATATFRAGGRSGDASVSASSGSATASAAEIIKIGDARATAVIVTASPTNLPAGGGRAQIKAVVTDEAGNQLSNIGVIFSTDHGTLVSGGSVKRTSENGAAFDTVIVETTTTTGLTSVTVTATTLNQTTGSVTLEIGTGGGGCSFVISPTDVVVNEPVIFTDTTPDQGSIVSSDWDFGDGSHGSGRSVSHTYRITGTFTVIHTVRNSKGGEQTCIQEVIVSAVSDEITCAFNVNLTEAKKGQGITFDASGSTSSEGNIIRYEWSFGDGDTSTESDPITFHAYDKLGEFTPVLTVTDDLGNQATCGDTTITVTNP